MSENIKKIRNFIACILLPFIFFFVSYQYSVFTDGEAVFGVICLGIFWIYFLICAVSAEKWKHFILPCLAVNLLPLALLHLYGFIFAGIAIFTLLLFFELYSEKRAFLIANTILLFLTTFLSSLVAFAGFHFARAFGHPPFHLLWLGIALPCFLSLLFLLLRLFLNHQQHNKK